MMHELRPVHWPESGLVRSFTVKEHEIRMRMVAYTLAMSLVAEALQTRGIYP